MALNNADPIDTEIGRIFLTLKSNIYYVNWLNFVGEPFTQDNGIKHGGGLSDKIFALCYNDVISICQLLGPSISITSHFLIW